MSNYRMPFGKFKGLPLDELSDDYLIWLYSRPNLRDPLRAHVDFEYQRRLLDEEENKTAIVPTELLKMAEQVVTAGFRSLAVKFHPDRGGDHKTMAQLNRAMDFLRKGLERVAV